MFWPHPIFPKRRGVKYLFYNTRIKMTDKKKQVKNDEEVLEIVEWKENIDENLDATTDANDPMLLKVQELEKKIIALEVEKKDQDEITKKAQYDYINLKMDFDRTLRVGQEKEKTLEVEKTIDVTKKFLPFVEELRKIVENIPEEKKEDPTFKWVQLVSDKIIKMLETMWINPIESVWLEPDSFLHEPINVVPTEDEKMKWKIIQEYERGFVYDKNWVKKVITSSKVIIGS